MQQFFEKYKKQLLRGGVVLMVLITVIASGKQLNATLLESAIGVVVTPFQDLTTGITSWVDETITEYRNKTDLKEENTELKNQIASLLEENRRLAMYESENAKLSALLKIAQRYPTYESIGATIIAKDPGVWYDGFTIDKGTNDGVRSEMGVFSDKGVVGIVYQSSGNYSIVIPLLNGKSNVNCRVKGSNSYCALQWDGNDARYSYLVDLPRYTVFEKGDTVVTSGFSSIFPADIPVGRIHNLEESEDGLFYRAKVELFVDFTAVSNVFVVGNDGKEEQDKLEKSILKL